MYKTYLGSTTLGGEISTHSYNKSLSLILNSIIVNARPCMFNSEFISGHNILRGGRGGAVGVVGNNLYQSRKTLL